MKFDLLSFNAIKGVSRQELALDHVTVFHGPHRMGKTAAMEATRLAATNTASPAVGASTGKQKMLTQGRASVRLSGDMLANWLYDKKRIHTITFDGMVVSNIHGNIPVTTDEFWGLTGAERWKLLENAVGEFSEQEPDSGENLKEQLKKLESQIPPPEYTGNPLAILKEKASGIKSFLDSQAELRKNVAYRKQRLQQNQQRLKELQEMLVKEKGKLKDGENALDDWQKLSESIEDELENIQLHDDGLQAYGGNKFEATKRILSDFAPQLRLLVASLEKTSSHRLLMEMQELATNVLDLISEDESLAVPFVSKHQEIQQKVDPLSIRLPKWDRISDVTWIIDDERKKRRAALQAMSEKVAAIEEEIDTRSGENSEESKDLEGVADPATVAAKAEELEAINRDIATAESWLRWMDGEPARLDKMNELRAQIDALEASHQIYKQNKQAYLYKASSVVLLMANKMLKQMGLPPMELNVDLKGKRSSMSVTCQGIDITTMSGSERVVYGSLALFALAQANKPKLPLLWIEAAEINREMLDSLCAAFSSAFENESIQGNVFIAHWCSPSDSTAELPNVAVHCMQVSNDAELITA